MVYNMKMTAWVTCYMTGYSCQRGRGEEGGTHQEVDDNSYGPGAGFYVSE